MSRGTPCEIKGDHKLCTRCDLWLKFSEFPKHPGGTMGLHSHCRKCRLAMGSDWKKRNRERVRENQRKWQNENREHRREQAREWYQANKASRKDAAKALHERNRKEWLEILPKDPRCEICDRPLTYWSGHQTTSVHFDHKKNGLPITHMPSGWLQKNRPTPEKVALWRECDFGILCLFCNTNLPTENRIDWLTRAVRYAGMKLHNKRIPE